MEMGLRPFIEILNARKLHGCLFCRISPQRTFIWNPGRSASLGLINDINWMSLSQKP